MGCAMLVAYREAHLREGGESMEARRRLVTARRGLLAAVLLAGLALPACAGGGGTVEVTLQ
jgi:hypothetical protein